MAQMNAVVGGFAQNVETLGRFRTQAASAGADLVLTPELSLMGYPPEDLLLKEGFIEASRVALIEMALLDNVPPVLVGTVVSEGLEDIALAPSSDGRDVARPAFGELGSPHIANALGGAERRRRRRHRHEAAACRTTTSSTNSATSIRASDRTPSST
jgi:hypothetical protein